MIKKWKVPEDVVFVIIEIELVVVVLALVISVGIVVIGKVFEGIRQVIQ